MRYIFIDIRKSDEVYSKRFKHSHEYGFYNIPMNMIRFNADTIIEHLDYVDEIYIVCRSSARSQFIKDKYFSNYNNIKVNKKLQFLNLNHGNNKISLNNDILNVNVIGSNSYNFYNVMRIMQTIFGIVVIFCTLYIYINLSKQKLLKKINIIPLLILLLSGIMATYNGLTATCYISVLLKNYIN